MKKIAALLILLITLTLSSVSFASVPMGDPSKDPGGFRGFPWGTSVNEVSSKEDLHFLGTEKLHNEIQVQAYFVPYDMGNIIYVFIDNKLYSGTLEYDPINTELLIRTSIEMYGDPTDINNNTYFWIFEKTRIHISSTKEKVSISYNDAKMIKKIFGEDK